MSKNKKHYVDYKKIREQREKDCLRVNEKYQIKLIRMNNLNWDEIIRDQIFFNSIGFFQIGNFIFDNNKEDVGTFEKEMNKLKSCYEYLRNKYGYFTFDLFLEKIQEVSKLIGISTKDVKDVGGGYCCHIPNNVIEGDHWSDGITIRPKDYKSPIDTRKVC